MNDVFRPILRLGFASCILLAIFTLFPSACFAQNDDDGRERRNWDPVEFMKRLDRDGDGQLNTEEMGGRSGRFISELGFDVSRPVVIDRVIKKIDSDKKAEAAQERRKGYEATRTIPGFGDEVIDIPGIPGFGMETANGSSATGNVSGNFDEETENTIKAIMERYDDDEDGFLAGDETRRVGRWVGSFEECDTDKDGKLGPAELGEGIKKQMQRRRSGEESQSANDESRNGNEDRGRGRGSERERGQSSSSESAAENAPKNPAPSSSTRSMDGRMSAYVDGVFQKYDKNSDNQLDKDELATVKVQFKDTDGDGIISRDEATNFVAGAQKSGGSVSPAYIEGQRESRNRRSSQSSNNERSNEENANKENPNEESANEENANIVPGDVVMSGKTAYGGDSLSRQTDGDRRDGASDKFMKLDGNNDGQLQMNEFSNGKEWSDDLYKDFVGADGNGDGVITPGEFDR